MNSFLEILGTDVETTSVANVKVGTIADKVITLGKINLSAKNTNKIENIEFDLSYTFKKGKGLFTVSNRLRDQYPELENVDTGFNQYYKPAENKLYVAICTKDDSKPAAQQPLFYDRKRGELKGNTFTAASLSYYAERAGLIKEDEEGTTYFNLEKFFVKSVDAEGNEISTEIPKLFTLELSKLDFKIIGKPEEIAAKAVEVVEQVEAPLVVETVTATETVVTLQEIPAEVVVKEEVVIEETPEILGEGSFANEINAMMEEVNAGVE